jgi:hypothetical protein
MNDCERDGVHEFVLVEQFYRLVKFWWLILICGLIGGGVGFFIYQSHPSEYESKAIFYVTLDIEPLQKLNLPANQYQYNEDLALNVTGAILVEPELLSTIVMESSKQSISVTKEYLLNNSTIERKHAFWELRFRHADPQISQSVTNLWAEKAYETMLTWSKTGKAANYVIFTPPALSVLPDQPVNYGLNRLMLAGFLAGFLAGILLTEIIARIGK